MPIEIIADGPARRVKKAAASTDHYKQREHVEQTAHYTIERSYQVAQPDLSYYLSEHPHAIATELAKVTAEQDGDVTGWDVSSADPDRWTVSVHADADALLESAEQAAKEQDHPAESILLSWAEYDRAPSSSCLQAYEALTGETAPVGEA